MNYKVTVLVAIWSGNSLAMEYQNVITNCVHNMSCWNGMLHHGTRYRTDRHSGVCRNGTLVPEGSVRCGQKYKIGEKFIVDGNFEFECYLTSNGEISERHVGCTSAINPGMTHYVGQTYDDGDVRKKCTDTHIDSLGCLIETYYIRNKQFYPFNSTFNTYYGDLTPEDQSAIGMGTCTMFNNGTYKISTFAKCDFFTQNYRALWTSLRAGCTKYVRDPSGGQDTKFFLSCRTGDISIKSEEAFIYYEGRKKYLYVDENLKCDA